MTRNRARTSVLAAALGAGLLLSGCAAGSSGGPDRLAALPAESAGTPGAQPGTERAPATVVTVPPAPPAGGLADDTTHVIGNLAVGKAKPKAAKAKVKVKAATRARAKARARTAAPAAPAAAAVAAAVAAGASDGLEGLPPEVRAYVEMLRHAADATG